MRLQWCLVLSIRLFPSAAPTKFNSIHRQHLRRGAYVRPTLFPIARTNGRRTQQCQSSGRLDCAHAKGRNLGLAEQRSGHQELGARPCRSGGKEMGARPCCTDRRLVVKGRSLLRQEEGNGDGKYRSHHHRHRHCSKMPSERSSVCLEEPRG